jgi:hypothetical protein
MIKAHKICCKQMYNVIKRSRIIFVLLLILTAGCAVDKYESTIPADLHIQFKIDKTPVMEGSLTVKSIAITLNSIEIDGKRTEGEDIYMTRKFDQPRQIKVNDNEILNFNIPQGIYDRLAFNLKFAADLKENEFNDDFKKWINDMDGGEDLEVLQERLGAIIENFLDEVTPCVLMHAEYQSNQQLFNVYFVINDPLSLSLNALNRFGNREVIIDKNIINRGEIILNPSNWFSLTQPSVIENAIYGVIDGEKYIFLHKKVNPLLFATIYNQFRDSATLIFN